MTLKAATIAAATSAILLAATGSAQAYDRDRCNTLFAEANVAKVEKFRASAGQVDFGDNPHMFGSPFGDAVVCWSVDGRVAVVGKVYADVKLGSETLSRARVIFTRSNGAQVRTTTDIIGGFGASATVNAISPTGNFNRVRVELYNGNVIDDSLTNPTPPPPPTLRWSKNFSR